MCKSRKSAERTLENIVPYITEKLFLKVNLKKTTVSHISKVKYLGYGFYRSKEKCRFRVHPKPKPKMKNKLRKLAVRGNKWSNSEREKKLRDYVKGWIEYFRYADMKILMERTCKWLRHRIWAVYWKQWKKGHMWRTAGMLNSTLTETIRVNGLGYPPMSVHYLKVRVNY